MIAIMLRYTPSAQMSFYMRLIDTHCHFDHPLFDADRDERVRSMNANGVSDVIFPATTAAGWGRLRDIAYTSAHFHASYGLHPMFMTQHQDKHIAQLRQWLEHERPVAVGECGLDFFVADPDKQRQISLFEQHIRLAREFDLPLIIHARKSLDEVLKPIRRLGSLRGVIHSFSGSQQQAEQLIEQGFYLGVGGTATYDRAKRLHKVIMNVPLERILLETDAPDQPDSQWRGKRNEPGRLPVIANTVAALTGTTIETIARTTTGNAQQLFGIA
ncbi:MAG: Putative deoxyribonuclease YjjV [uncultured Thiotrichaceae bacterium]|uniref:Deoxyribonuclease YjjV n=1 Tax=uncultured Thiotrichaceae bacterium TaxID=298394 RepID=A0A6S6TR08_9GAMM|nr:MAG: Putative deoxyribonuclease YjjV [uncultured Thiotrichaceae bacterium]